MARSSLTNDPTITPAGGADNGPALTAGEFEALFDRLRRWGNGADVDQAGTIAGLGDAQRLAALSTVRAGRTVSLSHPIDKYAGPDNARPALHHMVEIGDVEPPEPSAHKDFIGLDYHGKSTTHLDALCHMGYRGQLFGGTAAATAFTSAGSAWAAVTTMAAGLIVRGVLVDMPAVLDVPWLEPGTAVRAGDLVRAEERFGYRIGPHDAVLLRSGHAARKAAVGAWDADGASAGLHVDAMPLLADRGIALLGSDGDSDVRPSPVTGVHSPIHALALTALGMPLLDNLALEELSAACAETGRYEFLLVVAPLVIPRGTGSPVNPIAVL